MKCKKNINQDEIGKIISRTDDNFIKIQYKDEVDSPFGSFINAGIGAKFSSINGFFLDYLNAFNVSTGFRKISDNNIILQDHCRFPFYCKVLNIIDKRSSKIFNTKAGQNLPIPIIQFHYGCEKDNIISESHLYAYDICSTDDVKIIKRICSKVNAVLKPYFERRDMILAEVNCFFGKCDDKLFLIDDFTPLSLKVIPGNSIPRGLRNIDDFVSYTDLLLNLTNT